MHTCQPKDPLLLDQHPGVEISRQMVLIPRLVVSAAIRHGLIRIKSNFNTTT